MDEIYSFKHCCFNHSNQEQTHIYSFRVAIIASSSFFVTFITDRSWYIPVDFRQTKTTLKLVAEIKMMLKISLNSEGWINLKKIRNTHNFWHNVLTNTLFWQLLIITTKLFQFNVRTIFIWNKQFLWVPFKQNG